MNSNAAEASRRILVIDDNESIHADFRKILTFGVAAGDDLKHAAAGLLGGTVQSLQRTHFELQAAFQGQEGLAAVQEAVRCGRPFEMAFVDVRMPPGWDGIETVGHLWEVEPDLQIVICTAYSDYSWDDMFKRLGNSDRLVILKKPFDNIEVVQLAHALTQKWRLHQQARARTEQLQELVTARTWELEAANRQLKTEMAEHARTEEALRQAQKMEALGRLAGGIAHDFNNLLTVIRGYAQCALAETPSEPVVGEALGEIDKAAARAANLTSQMLMFGRKKRMQPQLVDLNETVKQQGRLLARVLGEDIQLQIQACDQPLNVEADPVMIEQVILNLAVNARDAMPQGGRLSIGASHKNVNGQNTPMNSSKSREFACIRVADTGSGIAPEAREHLFEPFFTTKAPGKGTGLGLATAYGIVKQHEGWINVESQPGRGAAFDIYLPLSANLSRQSPATASRTELPRGTETILLVEDEPSLRRLARRMLQAYGYHVLEAASGPEALSLWDQNGSDITLLLTDMVMPGGLTGRQLAEQLRERKPGLRVIFTTGYSLEAIGPDDGLEEGMNFLAKPYDARALVEVVRRRLDAVQP